MLDILQYHAYSNTPPSPRKYEKYRTTDNTGQGAPTGSALPSPLHWRVIGVMAAVMFLVAVLAALASSQNCSCLTSLSAFGISGSVDMRIDGSVYDFGRDYGLITCDSHDANTGPSCSHRGTHGSDSCALDGDVNVEELLSHLWCFDQWCYVNGSECSQGSSPSGAGGYELVGLTDPAGDLHYSYSACGLSCDYHSHASNVVGDVAVLSERAAASWRLQNLFTGFGVAVCCVMLILCFMYWRYKRRNKQQLRKLESGRLRHVSTRLPAVAVPLGEGLKYHLFLSHVWGLGQDRMRVIKDRLDVLLPSLIVFLDVDDLEEGGGADDLICASTVLVYLTSGYFASRNCMREALWATCLGKRVVLLVETDRSKGGITLSEAHEQLAESVAKRFPGWGIFEELQGWIDNQLASEADDPGAAPAPSPTTLQLPGFADIEGVILGAPAAIFGGVPSPSFAERAVPHASSLRVPGLIELEIALFGPPTRAPKVLGHEVIREVYEWSPLRAFQDVMLRKLAEPFVDAPPESFKAVAHVDKAVSTVVSTMAVPTTTTRSGLSYLARRFSTRPGTAPESAEESPEPSFGTSFGTVALSSISENGGRHWLTFVEDDIERKISRLDPPRNGLLHHVYASPLNKGAWEVLDELKSATSPALGRLKVCTDFVSLDRCVQMIVYLRGDSWSAPGFEDEVLTAMAKGKPLLLVHEQEGLGQEGRDPVPFETVIASTPRELMSEGIYSKIAVPLKGGILRLRSLAMLAEVLIAVKQKRNGRRSSSMRASMTRAPSSEATIDGDKSEAEAISRGSSGGASGGSPTSLASLASGLGESALAGLRRGASSGSGGSSSGSLRRRASPGVTLQRDEGVWDRLGGGLSPYLPSLNASPTREASGGRKAVALRGSRGERGSRSDESSHWAVHNRDGGRRNLSVVSPIPMATSKSEGADVERSDGEGTGAIRVPGAELDSSPRPPLRSTIGIGEPSLPTELSSKSSKV